MSESEVAVLALSEHRPDLPEPNTYWPCLLGTLPCMKRSSRATLMHGIATVVDSGPGLDAVKLTLIALVGELFPATPGVWPPILRPPRCCVSQGSF